MKFVDSLVSSKFAPRSRHLAIEARVTVSKAEYKSIQSIFNSIQKNSGQLNLTEQQEFKLVKRMLARFRSDWRYKEFETEAKNTLLKAALSLNATKFEDLFPTLQYFLKKSNLQAIFEQVYIALNYNKEILEVHKMDFVSRIYLERMSTVFELLKPNLTKKQIQKWEENVARKLKRF